MYPRAAVQVTILTVKCFAAVGFVKIYTCVGRMGGRVKRAMVTKVGNSTFLKSRANIG